MSETTQTERTPSDPREVRELRARLTAIEDRLAHAEAENRRLRAETQPRRDAPTASGAELLSLRSRIRELTADLHRALQYLSTTREHVDGIFDSTRWRLGSSLVDRYLWLRGREKPPTAEDHLHRLFRDVDAWEARHRAFRPAAPQMRRPATRRVRERPVVDRETNIFYRRVDDLLHGKVDPAFSRSFEAGESSLSAYRIEMAAAEDEPSVSIIMPTFDRAHVLDEAIGSVLAQTYDAWELIVSDDGSTDGTKDLVAAYGDRRIRYLRHDNAGAAVARNRALREAHGELIAYLDTDNVWHPEYLACMVGYLVDHPGHLCVYSKHIDVVVEGNDYRLKRFRYPQFDYEALAEKNFVDLNAFLHRRELYDVLGGFDERLRRQQDWDLVLSYTILRDPLFLDAFLVLYRRNADWDQITIREHGNESTVEIVRRAEQERHRQGPTIHLATPRPSVTVLSWDICRNHFSKAYNLAEALSQDRDVELIGFRFFENEIFPPYEGEQSSFPTKYLDGTDFPDFNGRMVEALSAIEGDVVYAVKPRLPSLGLGLLANFHFGKPLVVELNDLESAVADPTAGPAAAGMTLGDLRPDDPRLLSPFHQLWSEALESLVPELPHQVTHNANLDSRFGSKSYQVRNLKDEAFYDPARHDRDAVRARLGFRPEDRVLLFGGMVRRHKGIFALLDFVEGLEDPRYKLLVAGSRTTPDQKRLAERAGDRILLLPPQPRNAMAEINLAADAVVLWLDPATPASHYQMPYKLTDALAMGVPVLANPISDLAALGPAGYLRLVEYGDFAGLGRALDELFDDPQATREMVERGRRLYLRQFSYRAARANLELILRRVAGETSCLPAAERFVEFFSRFYETASGAAR